MKKIISIARIVLLLFFRSGAGWGLIGLTMLLSGFMFFATNSDNLLINELHLRIQYSLYFFTVLLNVALIYFSCVTLRKDIDERRFHTIAAAPVYRAQIWMGKFLGVIAFGLIVFLAGSAAIAVSCFIFVMQWENRDEVAKLDSEFFRTYYVCNPDLTLLEGEIDTEYTTRRKALEEKQSEEKKKGEHIHDENCRHGHADDPHEEHEPEEEHQHNEGCGHDHSELEGWTWRSRKALLDEVRKDKQMIAPGDEGQWVFNWDHSAVKGDYILLRFKFYSNNRRSKVKGEWSFAGSRKWKHEFSGYPFITHEIRIPADLVANSKKIELVYKTEGSSYVIFPVYHDGISLLYDSGGLIKNYMLLLLFSILHMATLTALSLTFSSLFSYSVAVFIATATYITGAFSTFFQNVLNDLAFHDETFINVIFSKMIEVGLWITEGTKAFPVNEMFSEGISIPAMQMIKHGGWSFIIYLGIVTFIGIFALTRKEIDKILQN